MQAKSYEGLVGAVEQNCAACSGALFESLRHIGTTAVHYNKLLCFNRASNICLQPTRTITTHLWSPCPAVSWTWPVLLIIWFCEFQAMLPTCAVQPTGVSKSTGCIDCEYRLSPLLAACSASAGIRIHEAYLRPRAGILHAWTLANARQWETCFFCNEQIPAHEHNTATADGCFT